MGRYLTSWASAIQEAEASTFGHYLGRHKTMEEHRKNSQQAA
ncbi:hypothetical protein [Archangium lansingense]|uniref:Uncharacterized protein n=1 Tax=Archangium lansingense TaxID=2995310 RepID=A0ABT4A467_9BACT|nr:hypothetical protein [Archangium lansinium]MCY1076443.1 hypothetical protein [Archangium lansinium]